MRELHILGGGFAGVWAAMSAAAERDTYDARDVRIRLFSNSPSLTIRPRLYEGASPDLRVPLAPLMKEIGVDFSVAEASNIVPQTRTIHFADGSDSRYDRLVLATGSRLRPLPIPGADIHAFSIDTFEEASRLDRHLEQLPPGDEASATVVIIGASFTGLELATELRSRLGKETRIILVDRMTKIGADLGANPEPHIEEAIKTCDIETRLETGERQSAPMR
ncbi:NAD(P)/FAD-dependent oxidoreductase [Marinobacterium aestuariivivens]|uniref:NAD(P)/FAD-dependent oxidoreductase n=1 Tax=Marinobacterium aestuariivivens TaxID=1698799 RepID=A0ABW1ZXS0_9GAMM